MMQSNLAAEAELRDLRLRLEEAEAEIVRLRQISASAGYARDAAHIREEIAGTDTGNDPFAAAVRATRMPMVISNPRLPDNPIVFVNDAFCRLCGYSRSEIVGRNCRFLQGADTDPDVVARIRNAVEAARTISTDILNYRKTGEPFWNRLLLAPVRDTEGVLAYFFASQVDVTLEREKLEGLESHNAALMAELSDRSHRHQENAARLNFATEAGRLGIWEHDFRTGTLIASAITKENFGCKTADPFTSDQLEAAVHPDDREARSQAWTRSKEGQGDYDVEHRVGCPDGSLKWVHMRAQVIRAANGTAERMTGVSMDVTARKIADLHRLAMVKLGDRIRDVSDPNELGYAAAEILGRTLEVSRAGFGLLDLQAELITIARDWNAPGIQSLAGVLHFRDYGSYIDDLKQGRLVVFSDARTDPRTADGAAALEAISARASLNLPVDEGTGLIALFYLNNAEAREWTEDEIGLVREVAGRTRTAIARLVAERDLRKLAASLEQQVEMRAAAHQETEEQLRQSQKMEAVGQLTGGLAHDFNNLLTGISGSLDLLSSRIKQGRIKEIDRYVIAAQGASARAAALTHRLLAFSRRQTLDPKPTDVAKLVIDMVDLVTRTVGPSIAVETVNSTGLWTALVDPNQLENALLNLCINARDAMPDGGRITIETCNKWIDERSARERDIAPGQYLALCVTDTGAGMPPDVIARAFDPFFTTKPLGLGTGLGLSMIYGFARQSGGLVRIYSEVGQGSMVCIYLPRHYGPQATSAASDERVRATEAKAGETVLIVDDEPTIQMLVNDVLSDFGYHAIEAADGPAGLKVLQGKARVDLLVTDVGLPGGMNGRQVADAARELRPDLKVLFITGYAENAVIGNGNLDPGMAVLTKPFAMNDLAHKIRELIQD